MALIVPPSSLVQAHGAPYNEDSLINSLKNVLTGCDWLSQHGHDVERLSQRLTLCDVESVIAELTTLACDLRTVYNRSSAIDVLPVEILSHIFELVATMWRPFSCSPEPLPARDILCVWPITGVCRHWRNVAIHTPAVWSAISLDCGLKPSTIARSLTSLHRSRISPLIVYIDRLSLTESQSEIVRNTMAQMDRIRDLRILPKWHSLDLLPLIYANAPLLQTLAIQFEKEVDGSKPDNNPTSFNDWHTPNVENLCMQGFTSWLEKPWRKLRSLCIGSIRTWSVCHAKRLLDLLVEVGPTLEDFALFDSVLSEHVYAQLCGYQRQIQMPALKRIVECRLNEEILEMLTSRLVLATSCFQQVSQVSSSKWSTIAHSLSSFTPKRLFVRQKSVFCVRDSSALFLDQTSWAYASEPPVTLVPVDAVEELWIDLSETCQDGRGPLGMQIYSGMHGVKKLIFAGSLRYPAIHLGPVHELLSCFPLLEEVQVQEYDRLNRDDIGCRRLGEDELRFLIEPIKLRERTQVGRPKLVVHLGHMEDEDLEHAQRRWAECAADLEGSAVNVEIRTARAGHWKGPLRMDIPKVCREPSPLDSSWGTSWRVVEGLA